MGTSRKAVKQAPIPSIGLSTLPLEDTSEQAHGRLVELQMRMATSSINHEYARLRFEDLRDVEDREDLLEYMHDCRREYFDARAALEVYDPYSLADFEADLMRQKQATLTHYSA